MNSISRTERILLGVFLAALVYSLWTASVGWNAPIIENHDWRQTQTAVTAFYMRKGGPFFAYETPVLGSPWSIPMELPVYQWLVAKLSSLSGMALDQAGRFVGRLFFYLTLIPLAMLLGRLGLPRPQRWIFLALYLVSPLLLFWSRTFMIESTALFFAVAYLAAVAESLHTRQWRYYAAATTFGILGATVKITTFFAFGAAAALLIVQDLHGTHGWQMRRWLRAELVPQIATFALLPFLAVYFWTDFSDHVKAANPMANFLLSKELHRWNFGTLAQRFDGDLWYMFHQQINGAIGHRAVWVLSVVAILFVRKRRWHYLLCSLLFLLPPLTFTNLHLVHNYYAYANVLFLILALGFCIAGLVEQGKAHQLAGYTLFVLALALAARNFMITPYPMQKNSDSGLVEYGERIRAITKPDDVLLIYGLGFNPMIVYYAERRGLMNRDYVPNDPRQMKGSDWVGRSFRLSRDYFAMDSWQMQTSLKNLGNLRVGALILCDKYNGDRRLWEEVNRYIKFEPEPAIQEKRCEVYKRENSGSGTKPASDILAAGRPMRDGR